MTDREAGSPGPTLACLILDDPLLRPTYGCLDYRALLERMKAHDFFTEIAFIPWNYRRNDPGTIRLFADNPDRFAVCVHGCDHLGNEFGGEDYDELSALSSLALWRMEQHRKITGLPYDPVMVFPQGRFSSVAMRALRDRGFLAAFNSTLRATDAEEPPAAEYEPPATTMYHDFPLFLRRYPRDRERFVDDVASGRPVLVVEHHGAFRNGYREMTDLVDWINGLGDIRWTSLGAITERYAGTRPAVPPPAGDSPPPHRDRNTRTMIRRYLSEARDNHLETSGFLSKAYRLLRG